MKTMKGLFTNFNVVDVSEISDKTNSATFHKILFFVAHRYARFKVKNELCIFRVDNDLQGYKTYLSSTRRAFFF